MVVNDLNIAWARRASRPLKADPPLVIDPNAALPVPTLVLLLGSLFATLFHDRGNSSPEFLWRSRIATAVILGGVAWFGLAVLRRRNQRPVAPVDK